MSDTSKTAKIIKRWYHSPSHRLTVNVLLNNITFLWFLLFSTCHSLHVAVNKCINWCFVHFLCIDWCYDFTFSGVFCTISFYVLLFFLFSYVLCILQLQRSTINSTERWQYTDLTTWQQWCSLNLNSASISNNIILWLSISTPYFSRFVIWHLTHSFSQSTHSFSELFLEHETSGRLCQC